MITAQANLLKSKTCRFGTIQFLELFNTMFQLKLVEYKNNSPEEFNKSFFYVDKSTRLSQRSAALKIFSRCRSALSKGDFNTCEELLS